VASKHGKVGLRYARALLKALVSQGAAKERLFSALESLEALDLALKSNREAQNILMNPMLASEKKEKLVRDLLTRVSGDALVVTFTQTLLKNGRFAALSEVSSHFKFLVYQQAGMVAVTVTSARDMQEDERKFIVDSLRSRLPGEPELLWQVNPEIIGGIVVEYEGHRIDASLRGRLQGIERELLV
jgi:ATP synthase F1 delta subunit